LFRVVDEHRARRGDRRDDVDPATLAAPGLDLEGRLDDERRLRELAEGMRARLGERERRAAVLCYLHGFTRDEAADALGLRAARMQKVMGRAAKVVAGVVADVREDAWCPAKRSLITAYALGVLETGGPATAWPGSTSTTARAAAPASVPCAVSARSSRRSRCRGAR
jgi:hypothetical protein